MTTTTNNLQQLEAMEYIALQELELSLRQEKAHKIRERKEEATKRTKDCISLLSLESCKSSLSLSQKKRAKELSKKISNQTVGTVSLFPDTMTIVDREVLTNFTKNDQRLRDYTLDGIEAQKIIIEDEGFSNDANELADLEYLSLSLEKMEELMKGEIHLAKIEVEETQGEEIARGKPVAFKGDKCKAYLAPETNPSALEDETSDDNNSTKWAWEQMEEIQERYIFEDKAVVIRKSLSLEQREKVLKLSKNDIKSALRTVYHEYRILQQIEMKASMKNALR